MRRFHIQDSAGSTIGEGTEFSNGICAYVFFRSGSNMRISVAEFQSTHPYYSVFYID